jgi:hypothetical protein
MSCVLVLCAACGEYKVLGEDVQATTGGASTAATTQNPESTTGGTSSILVNATGGSSVVQPTSTGGATPQSSDPHAGACPLVNPSARVYYPGEADSPCPPGPPSAFDILYYCDVGHLTNACIYAAYPAPGYQEIATCGEEGMNVYSWSSKSERCNRAAVDACLESFDVSSGTVEVIAVTSDCSTRTTVACDPTDNHTAQAALDMHIASIAKACAESVLGFGESAALSVWFTAGCTTGFSVRPISLKDCVKQRLESDRYDCVGNLPCAASGKVGGCDLC